MLYVPSADALVEVHGAGTRNCWWDAYAAGPAGFPERDVRALVASGDELGRPTSAGSALDAAERDVLDSGYDRPSSPITSRPTSPSATR